MHCNQNSDPKLRSRLSEGVTTAIQNSHRLTFRRLAPGDVSFIMAMEADPEVMRHTTGRIEPTETRRAELLSAFAATPDVGLGHWCVVLQTKPIGWVSLTPLEATGRIQLAYRFVRDAWGHGFATEAGEAALEYAQAGLGLPECVAIVWPANSASSRVLSKLRFRSEGRAQHHGHEVDVLARSLGTAVA
jgi:RimJ/RimL family protein N-acetyltransferase